MEAIKELLSLDFTAFILTVFVIMSGVIAAYNIIGKFFELIGKPLKWFKGKNADHDAIIRLEGKMKEYADNRIKDRQQSLQPFKANEEKENKRDRAKLKNSISEIYRYHHSTGQINDIELETLEDLIEEYESAGGENSFVHSLVQKEMYTWEKVERE